MTDAQMTALNKKFDNISDLKYINSVTIVFKETYTAGHRTFTIAKVDLIDITAVGDLIFIEYFVDGTGNVNTEMHLMDEIRTIYFDSIPTRSQQPF